MMGPLNIGGVVAKLVVEVGKALGKAVIAGVGLELARAASGRVKKVVGPKEDEQLKEGESPTKVPKASDAKKHSDDDEVDVVAELRRIQRENEALRKEVDALRAKNGEAEALAVDAVDDSTL